MEILAIDQGSDAWLEVRKAHFTASEAPAALGQSKYVTRTALLHQKATGIVEEVGQFKQALFDRGHQAEAAARAIAEQIVGGDLYPITATMKIDGLDLLASLDGATMDEEIIWEHKLFSEELAADVRAGTLAPHYTVQMDQQLLVSGAKKCLFMTSDGTEQNMAYCWYEADQEKFDALVSGWAQFERDLADYTPPEVVAEVVAAPQTALPSVFVQVSGGVAVRDNLNAFGDALKAYVERINRKPETDQDFADLEATVKTLKAAEEALDAAEAGALAQTESIDLMRRLVAEYRELARSNRLVAEKVVKAEKENRRNAIVQKGKDAFAAHVATLNQRLGKPYMPSVPADFAGAVKGLKTMSSIQNAVDTCLANAKIEANAIADRIDANLKALREQAKDHAFLFADAAQLVLKAPEDCQATITARISEHKTAEDKRLADERERIAAEERAKAEAQAKAQMETTVTRTQTVMESHQQSRQTAAPVNKPVAAPSDTGARIRLGEINARISPVSITAEGLAQLGYPYVGTDKSAKLYRAADLEMICMAIAHHVTTVANALVQAA